jgi:transposase, IS30 family
VSGKWLSEEQQAEIWERARSGESSKSIARSIQRSPWSVRNLLADPSKRPENVRVRSTLRLSLAEREEISRGLVAGLSCAEIAAGMARAASTVSRDVAANGGRRGYRAHKADGAALRRARRPKPAKLAECRRLRREVEARLAKKWSPQQISASLVVDFPADLEMRVSHETIYMSLFVQSRGALRKELHACLRTGRAMRRPKGRRLPTGTGKIRDMVMISERPAEVADRAVPGHWEGDLILGKQPAGVGTLVERTSRFVMLFALPNGRTAEQVRLALIASIGRLPAELARSLTWDQGKELAAHAQFSIDTGIQVYFCDPHSPWQRGSNENTNGLLRQYLPRLKDLSVYTQRDLNNIARELNERPRQTLGWMTPSQKFAELRAMTG